MVIFCISGILLTVDKKTLQNEKKKKNEYDYTDIIHRIELVIYSSFPLFVDINYGYEYPATMAAVT